jgi:hypothetical protein
MPSCFGRCRCRTLTTCSWSTLAAVQRHRTAPGSRAPCSNVYMTLRPTVSPWRPRQRPACRYPWSHHQPRLLESALRRISRCSGTYAHDQLRRLHSDWRGAATVRRRMAGITGRRERAFYSVTRGAACGRAGWIWASGAAVASASQSQRSAQTRRRPSPICWWRTGGDPVPGRQRCGEAIRHGVELRRGYRDERRRRGRCNVDGQPGGGQDAIGQDVVLATFDQQLTKAGPEVGLRVWPEGGS